MTVIARRLAAVPRRTSVETWERLVELVSTDGSSARHELESIKSIASMLIAEEHTKNDPVRITGGGPLVRIYTLHGDDAIEHDLDDESELAFTPTSGDTWLLSLPAAGDDVALARAAVASATHVEVRDVADAELTSAAKTGLPLSGLVLDLDELGRP